MVNTSIFTNSTKGSSNTSTSEVIEANNRFASMQNEYKDGWESSHMDLRDYIDPTRGFFDDEANQGDMIDHKKVLDGHATLALEILAAGLLSGMTSPSRPWFKLGFDTVELNDVPEVREWLDETERRMNMVMNKSNIYQILFGTYKEIGCFGTGCFIVLEDFEDVIRGRSFTSGEYYISTDEKGRPNGFAREYWMTVEQLVGEFGEDNVSFSVMNDFNTDKRDRWVKVRHLIEKNKSFVADREDSSGKEYASLYWETAGGNSKFLAKRGFSRFPVLSPRWETTTTHQIYGKGPGWKSLGDVKQLQKTMDDKLKIQEKLHNPPMTADADIEGFVNLVPGGVTKTSANTPDGGVRPAYTVPDALQSFIEMEGKLKNNIDRFYFVNLFQMLINIDRTNMTATEVAERQQEKVMMLGPILHRLQEELLDPLIDLVFSIMFDNGLIPEPPVVIEGVELRTRYISVLAQAQQALGVQHIQRVFEVMIPLAQARPDLLDNFDFDEIAKQVTDLEGAPAKIILDENEVDELREQRDQTEAMAQMASIGKEGASAGKDFAQAQQIASETQ